MSEGFLPRWADLAKLAERCEEGGAILADEAERAAEIPPTRANGDRVDPAEWAAEKRRAAEAAWAYAAELRRLIAAAGEHDRPLLERYRQAEVVAKAAELGGILIDDRPVAAAGHDPEYQQVVMAVAEEKRAAIEGSGLFVHIDKTIGGVPQVPFWRLVGRQ